MPYSSPSHFPSFAASRQVVDLLLDSRRRTRKLVKDREADYGRARINYAVDQARATYEERLRVEADWAAQAARQRRLARKRQNQLYRDQLDRTAVQWIAAAQPPKEPRRQHASHRRVGAGPAVVGVRGRQSPESRRSVRSQPGDLYRPAEPGWGAAYAALDGAGAASWSSYRPPDVAVSLPRAPPGYSAIGYDPHASMGTHTKIGAAEPPDLSTSISRRSNHARRGPSRHPQLPPESYYV